MLSITVKTWPLRSVFSYSPCDFAYSIALQITHIDTISANMGGTEIGNALEWTFSNRTRDKPTAVFMLTDGQVRCERHKAGLGG